MEYSLLDKVGNRVMRHFPMDALTLGGSTPVVSFTFDDAPVSALRNGATILENHGARGTFYLAGGMAGGASPVGTILTTDQATDLAGRGHEIGCHTFSHPNIRAIGVSALASELQRNSDHIAQGLGVTPTNFAFPYNIASPRARPVLAKRFRSCRGGHEGINRGTVDRGYLHAVEIRQPEDYVAGLTRWVEDLVRAPGWLIFFTHDIAEAPSPYGCTPRAFEKLVSAVADAGCTIMTVDAALDHYCAPQIAPARSPY